ncbi:MAG: hypothetical protein U0892_08385 [Pirellulales bacterium]
MIDVKHTERSHVRISFGGTVHKSYFGAGARERMENEIKVLEYLTQRRCPFVPRLVDVDRRELTIEMTQCGYPVQQIGDEKLSDLFEELMQFGVDHKDRHVRNVTYHSATGWFFIVDFEFADICEVPSLYRLDALQRLIADELAGLNDLY